MRCDRWPLVLMVVLATTSIAAVALAETTPVEHARKVLEGPEYRFCHDATYRSSGDERIWCLLVSETTCPAFVRACAGMPPAADDAPPPRRRSPSAAVPTAMSPIASVVFVGLLLFGFAALVAAFARNRIAGDEPDSTDAPERRGDFDAPVAPSPPAMTDPERLLASARAAAARGEYGRAIADAHAAILRHLDAAGAIELHASRTNGDYVRALGGNRELQRRVAAVVRDVERVQFGRSDARSAWANVLENVAPVIGRVTVLAVLLGFGLAGCRPQGRANQSGPLGHGALVGVLAAAGVKAKRQSIAPAELDETVSTLVLIGDVDVDEEGWREIETWVDVHGGTLVLAGVDSAPIDLAPRAVSGHERTTTLTVAPGAPLDLGDPRVALPPGDALDPSPSDRPLVLRGRSTYATSRAQGDGEIVVLADDRLLSNASLATAENAKLVMGLLVRTDGEVRIAGAIGAGAKTPVDSLRRAHLLPATLQVLVLAALLVAAKGAMFGRPRDRKTTTRRAFIEHVRAIGTTYARARAARHALGVYATWALEQLRTRTRAGRGMLGLAESVATRTGRDERAVLSVLLEAHSARDPEGPRSGVTTTAEATRDLDTLRELAELVQKARTERNPRR